MTEFAELIDVGGEAAGEGVARGGGLDIGGPLEGAENIVNVGADLVTEVADFFGVGGGGSGAAEVAELAARGEAQAAMELEEGLLNSEEEILDELLNGWDMEVEEVATEAEMEAADIDVEAGANGDGLRLRLPGLNDVVLNAEEPMQAISRVQRLVRTGRLSGRQAGAVISRLKPIFAKLLAGGAIGGATAVALRNFLNVVGARGIPGYNGIIPRGGNVPIKPLPPGSGRPIPGRPVLPTPTLPPFVPVYPPSTGGGTPSTPVMPLPPAGRPAGGGNKPVLPGRAGSSVAVGSAGIENQYIIDIRDILLRNGEDLKRELSKIHSVGNKWSTHKKITLEVSDARREIYERIMDKINSLYGTNKNVSKRVIDYAKRLNLSDILLQYAQHETLKNTYPIDIRQFETRGELSAAASKDRLRKRLGIGKYRRK